MLEVRALPRQPTSQPAPASQPASQRIAAREQLADVPPPDYEKDVTGRHLALTRSGEPEWLVTNRANWDDRVPVHLASSTYDVEGFLAGRSSLDDFEIAELGSTVRGRSLVHLQCHFGLDTLSWTREGATVTGLDFSRPAIAAARSLASRALVEARFVEGDVFDAPRVLGEQYDVVYTGKGAVNWLPDIERWAAVLAQLCRPGGTVYVSEFHPFSWVFADDTLDVAFAYFHDAVPYVFDEPVSYTDPHESDEPVSYTDPHESDETAGTTDPAPTITHTRTFEWAHTLGDIVSALAGAGLEIEFLHEFAHTRFRRWPFLVRVGPDRFEVPDGLPSLPLMFSILATKPA